MNALLLLVPMALVLGGLALLLFLWTLRSRQYDDLDGAAARILFDDDPVRRPPGRTQIATHDKPRGTP
ncbi:cbb3-type cytochrome oxidase assembly protein CcoS [Pseudoroseomonas cervicalis]|uniref:cbb3-type cytochrome oxidase assembly protein CcoS n=1 Tax=Teichococcus cervicalis TaxID=204525 RepID=UPI0022F1C049|nr:cbb3-type cytochrome oxidase assembly protein CcoS [Pseudoroseomonas cervicalis]WBV43849.1 cbb3-type cytochrome oxidase assembly protein CcoS [Pseudoroseomonas cervicalis]